VTWARLRAAAGVVLVLLALGAGALVGNVLLLGSTADAGDPAGQLGARLRQAPPATPRQPAPVHRLRDDGRHDDRRALDD
jgi:hypothetical protein